MNDEERSSFLPPAARRPGARTRRQAGSTPTAAGADAAAGQLRHRSRPLGGQPQGGYQQLPRRLAAGTHPSRRAAGAAAAPAVGLPQQRVPDNNQAVAGFILSPVGGGLLLISAGLSTLLSVGLSIAGMVLGRGGKPVDAGETPKNRSLGQAGFWIGLVSLIFSVIATAIWLAVLIAALTDDEFQRTPSASSTTRRTSVVAAAAVRLTVPLVVWSARYARRSDGESVSQALPQRPPGRLRCRPRFLR